MSGNRWPVTMVATSSICHGGETRGTLSLLRRELVIQPDGRPVHVPVISGNALRGRLRRIGEELMRDTLTYEGKLSAAAAHALRGGGVLTKASREPLSGSRLQHLRELVPQIAVFGAAGGGCIIDGALSVGKVIPHLAETAHLTGMPSAMSAFTGVQLETYTRVDDTTKHDFQVLPAAALDLDATGTPQRTPSRQMIFEIETLPAGTTFSSWVHLRRPTPLEHSFLVAILHTWAEHATIGGRSGIGHGNLSVTLPDELTPDDQWRDHLLAHAEEILTAIADLG